MLYAFGLIQSNLNLLIRILINYMDFILIQQLQSCIQFKMNQNLHPQLNETINSNSLTNKDFSTPNPHSPSQLSNSFGRSSRFTDVQFVTPSQKNVSSSQPQSIKKQQLIFASQNNISKKACYDIPEEHHHSGYPVQCYGSLLGDVIKICDGIYIGMLSCFEDPDLFHSNFITHIIMINGGGEENMPDFRRIPTVKHLMKYQLTDNLQENSQKIRIKKSQMVDFIENAKDAGQSVLIFSSAVSLQKRALSLLEGLLDSAVVATQYLMLRYGWSLFKGLQFINSRIGAAYRSANIVKQLQNSSDTELKPPVIQPHEHLKFTQILLLKSKREISYNWQIPHFENNSQIEELTLTNTYLNSGTGKGIFMSYQQLLSSQRERSARKTRKSSPMQTKNNQKIENEKLSLLLNSKLNSKSHQNLSNLIRHQTSTSTERGMKKNQSLHLIDGKIDRHQANKTVQKSFIPKSILKEKQIKKHPKVDFQTTKQEALRKTKNYSLQINLKKSVNTSREVSKKSSKDKNQNITESSLNPISKKRLKWAQKLIVTQQTKETKTDICQTIQNPKAKSPAQRQKIILSVMELVGKKFVEKEQNQQKKLSNSVKNENQRPLCKSKSLGLKNRLVKSKIRLQTIKNFTNANLSTEINDSLNKRESTSHQVSQQSMDLGRKMITLPDILENSQKTDDCIDRNQRGYEKNQSQFQTLNTSMLCSIKVNEEPSEEHKLKQKKLNKVNKKQEGETQDHLLFYSKTQANIDESDKQNLIELTIQKLKQLKGKNIKQQNQKLAHKIANSQKQKKKLTIFI